MPFNAEEFIRITNTWKPEMRAAAEALFGAPKQETVRTYYDSNTFVLVDRRYGATSIVPDIMMSEPCDPKSFLPSRTHEADEVHCTGFEYLNTHHVGDGPDYSKLTRGKF